ncbi:hypothetical protein [Micromonospora echinofusca]|uniref:GDSL-like Lipase/Acylhydrolase family protein n=1 Tax=Micromonospora echinofusca TaxID=47858 RepID=A0A1C5G7U3_MICEH|nr:hypothetical protein [Micromonospora echinofusca]SCG15758.1 hypothetical protein GA0070610_2001 [Micromonospora echinofusca]
MTTPSSTATAPARFLLLGDSHAGPVARAATAAGVPFVGGPIGSGRDFNVGFFDVRDEGLVFRDAAAQERHRGFLGELGVADLGQLTVPLVSTFGLSAHFFATTQNWAIYRAGDGAFPAGFLAGGLFDGIVRAMARDALAFYRHALDLGLRVLAVLPPQRVPGMSDPQVFMAAQETIRRALVALGVEIVDLRVRVTDGTGRQRAAFCEPDDPIHGNLAFGRLIVADLLARGL